MVCPIALALFALSVGPQAKDTFVSFDTRDQTDDTFYAVTAWCRCVQPDAAAAARHLDPLSHHTLMRQRYVSITMLSTYLEHAVSCCFYAVGM